MAMIINVTCYLKLSYLFEFPLGKKKDVYDIGFNEFVYILIFFFFLIVSGIGACDFFNKFIFVDTRFIYKGWR